LRAAPKRAKTDGGKDGPVAGAGVAVRLSVFDKTEAVAVRVLSNGVGVTGGFLRPFACGWLPSSRRSATNDRVNT
jgi:hypothetical protein